VDITLISEASARNPDGDHINTALKLRKLDVESIPQQHAKLNTSFLKHHLPNKGSGVKHDLLDTAVASVFGC
jgi:hypothetical protein